jgi:hypothetical protein
LVLLAVALCASCSNEMAGGALDETAITARLADFDTSGEFTRIDAAPFDSQHAANTVSVWVSFEGLDTYLGVDPADDTDTVEAFETGTMIVKEMFDESGARAGMTVMVKGAEGGVADTADWWWGVYSATGTLQQGGNVGFCITCHEGNGLARTDWVAGVPLDNRRSE